MKKIQISEKQLKNVVKKVLTENMSDNKLAQIKKDLIGQEIELTTLPTKKRPEGIDFGVFVIRDAKIGEHGVALWIENKNSKNDFRKLYYDFGGTQKDLFLKNKNTNTGKLVKNDTLINYFNKFFAQ